MSAILKHSWYMAAWSNEIGDKPLYRQICGEHVALFRTSDGRINVIGAVCPHRGANLAEGKVVEDTLQCPFHGWQFGANGNCEVIPSQPADVKIPPAACVPTFSVVEQQGIVWIWPGLDKASDWEAPKFDFFEDDPNYGIFRSGPIQLDAHYINVVENATDASHLHFLHPDTFGIHTPILPRQIVEEDQDGRGLTVRWDPETPWGQEFFEQKPAGDGSLIKQIGDSLVSSKAQSDWRRQRSRFHLSGTYVFDDYLDNGERITLFAAATPIDGERTHFFTGSVDTLARYALGQLISDWLGKAINAEDRTGTEGLLVKGDDLARPVSVIADLPSTALRRLYASALKKEAADAGGEAKSAA